MTPSVIFFGSSESVFSSRHFAPLLGVCELLAVVDAPPSQRVSTNPLPDGLPDFVQVARERRIPSFAPVRPNDPSFRSALRALQPDLLLCAGYGQILKPSLLDVPRLLAANFHASLLPHYRGRHPVFWTLRNGEKWGGLTVHAMDAGIDTGDILYQVRVRTRRDDTVTSLYGRIMDRSVGLVPKLLHDVEQSTLARQPQDPDEGSYYSFTSEDDFRIDWRWPAEKIRRYVTITPGRCFGETEWGRLHLLSARAERYDGGARPGQIVAVGRTRCVVATGDGAVSLGRVRTQHGQETTAAAWCRHAGLAAGDSLVWSAGPVGTAHQG